MVASPYGRVSIWSYLHVVVSLYGRISVWSYLRMIVSSYGCIGFIGHIGRIRITVCLKVSVKNGRIFKNFSLNSHMPECRIGRICIVQNSESLN